MDSCGSALPPTGPDTGPAPQGVSSRVGSRPERRPLAVRHASARPLMVAGLLAMAVYGAFRLSTFIDGESFWPLNLLLFGGEMMAVLAQVALMFDAWRLVPFAPPSGGARPAVDVLVPVYDEPIEVVRPTLAGCLGQDYDGSCRVWLLDDGRRPELARLAEDLGVTYSTRPDNRGAKAGNLNHVLQRLDGELVTVLDCDMVPQPDYVSTLVPYFEDEGVGLVQTPHGFYNSDSFQHYSDSRHDQSLFYDVLQWGKDRHNASYWCGTGGMLRTRALREVGGVAEGTITEDFHTSIRLHAAGWTSRYHPVALSFGLGATNHTTYAGQRDRWGSGNVAVLHTPDSPLRVRGLRLRQRLSYLATLVGVLAGLRRICFVTGVALILATARIPFAADPVVLLATLSASVIGGMLAVLALARGRLRPGDLSRGEILALPAQLSALRTLVLGDRRPRTFKVTAKDATTDGWRHFVRTNRALAVLTIVLVVGVVVGAVRQATGTGLPVFAAALTFALAAWEGTQIGLAWRFGLRYSQRRTTYRVPIVGRPAEVHAGDRALAGRLIDLSPAGAAVELFDDAGIEVGDAVRFSIDGMPVAVESTVRRVDGWEIGLRFDRVPAAAGVIIDRVCYVDNVGGGREVVEPDTRSHGDAEETPAAATAGGRSRTARG